MMTQKAKNLLAIGVLLAAAGNLSAADPPLARDMFTFTLPIFNAPGSAWLANAATAAVLPESSQQVAVLYKVLCGDTSNLYPIDDPPTTDWPYPDVGYDEYTLPIFPAGAGQQSVLLCDYEGNLEYPSSKWGVPDLGGPVTVPAAAGTLRPSGPLGPDSDGHLILYDQVTATEYDFWQATTVRDGVCESHGGGLEGSAILETGYPDFFAISGDGSNPDGVASTRAMGTPLLAGMILPEDIASGAIEHALAVAIPGPRNLSPDPFDPLPSDYFYPASTTETDYYSTNPLALAAGQRIRLKATIVDDLGQVIDEPADLAPITRMFLQALRDHGAYLIDNASGFTFYAEDIHTGFLDLVDSEINTLIGEPPQNPLPGDKTKWELVITTLNEELEAIPFAFGTCDGAASVVITANYEIVEPASTSSVVIFADGFESGDVTAWASSGQASTSF